MNRYRVAMTVTNVEDFYHVAEAVDDEAARRFAKEAAEREHPNAFNVKVEYTELLAPERKAKPHQLALARDIIAGLLDAANQGSENLHELAECATDEGNLFQAEGYSLREMDADAAIAAARASLATKEPAT